MSAPGASSASTQGDPADTARTRLDQFYAYLDSGKTIEDQLAEVYVAGETSGLILKRAEYRLSGESSGRIARYEVTLPVTATYPQVRHFVNTVLGVLPSAALQSVSFQKKRITERNVEAEVVFRFYIAKRP